jgi:hypothetical protein
MSEIVKAEDWYKKIDKKHLKKYHNPGYKLHGIKVPFRGIIIGKTGAGKTSLFRDILHKFSNTFNRIVICCKTTDEPLYNDLQAQYSDIEFYEGGVIPDINDFKNSGQSLICFDDLVNLKDQKSIEEYFLRGRKVSDGISCLYLTQSYFNVPKFIRLQCNYIFMKQSDNKKDLKLILGEFSLGDIDISDFENFFKRATSDRLGFMLIDSANMTPQLKIRMSYGPSKLLEIQAKSKSF